MTCENVIAVVVVSSTWYTVNVVLRNRNLVSEMLRMLAGGIVAVMQSDAIMKFKKCLPPWNVYRLSQKCMLNQKTKMQVDA
jgi:hypothetical protein